MKEKEMDVKKIRQKKYLDFFYWFSIIFSIILILKFENVMIGILLLISSILFIIIAHKVLKVPFRKNGND